MNKIKSLSLPDYGFVIGQSFKIIVAKKNAFFSKKITKRSIKKFVSQSFSPRRNNDLICRLLFI